jgi:hypothetical protein
MFLGTRRVPLSYRTKHPCRLRRLMKCLLYGLLT